MTSCIVLSCAALYTALPQRLAGTASQYSKKAIPQLVRITAGSQLSLYLRWPYQANVMKILDPNSISTGRIDGGTVGMDILSSFCAWRSPANERADPNCPAQWRVPA